jgi:DNA-binding MarR family transcriptional regulator
MYNPDMIGQAISPSTTATNTFSAMDSPAPRAIKSTYIEALALVERLHRLLLDVVKDEFDRMGSNEISAVQAVLIHNIGDKEISAGELRNRGYYVGANVSYNLKKLVDMGYVRHERSEHDRRSVRISLTDKGRDIAQIVEMLYERHSQSLETVGGVGETDLAAMNQSLQRLERFWTDQIRYRM